MKNFPIINPKDNKEYWISRAIAAVVFLYAKDIQERKYILTVQRGKGTPDPEFVGKYCVPCGYLDYDETILQAAARELKEETGITIPNFLFRLVDINDNPFDDKRQNITFRYVINSHTPIEDLQKEFTIKNSEKDEVASIKFISIDNIDMYEWAFGHDKLIKQYSTY